MVNGLQGEPCGPFGGFGYVELFGCREAILSGKLVN